MKIVEIVTQELVKMMARQLDSAPSAAELPFTIQVMTEDLQRQGLRDEDCDRIAESFKTLGPVLNRWPTANHVIAVIPKREQKKLPSTPIDWDKQSANMQRIKAILNV